MHAIMKYTLNMTANPKYYNTNHTMRLVMNVNCAFDVPSDCGKNQMKCMHREDTP